MTDEIKKVKLETEIEVCNWFLHCFEITENSLIGTDIKANINRCKKELSELLQPDNKKMSKHIAHYFGLDWPDVLKVMELIGKDENS